MANDMNTDKITNDEIFQKWISSIPKRNTNKLYRRGLVQYCDLIGLTPGELLQLAKDDYANKVNPWESKTISNIDDFIMFLKNDKEFKQKYANSTKLSWLNAIKNFYTFYRIPIPRLNSGIVKMPRESYYDILLLKIEDIRKGALLCGNYKKLKALILTLLSSGQAQAEVRKLQGRHLKKIVSGTAIVQMTRGKTNQRYSFFIGSEALDAIKEYKPKIKDNEFVFTLDSSNNPLSETIINTMFARHADKIGVDRAYFAPHRFRHYFKTVLTGNMDSTFIEHIMGHRLPGVESNYFLGSGIQDKMLKAYIKNQDKLTVFTEQEVLQKQYDELKQRHDGLMTMFSRDMVKAMVDERMDELMKKG